MNFNTVSTEKLGTRLKRLRRSRGLNAYEVAEFLGVAASTYREWENGRAIRGEPYLKLAEILGVSVYELLSGEKPALLTLQRQLSHLDATVKEIKNEIQKFSEFARKNRNENF